MNGLRKTLLATGLAVLGTTGAQAADLYQPPIIEPLPIEEEFGGWYLRGYVGMSNQKVDELHNQAIATTYGYDLLQSDFNSAPFLGGAVGYQLNDWVRFDLSGEYRGKASYRGLDRYLLDYGADGIPGTPDDGDYDDNNYEATKSEWLVLANAFVDLGSWYGISPYVGAGIGASYNSIDDFTDIGISNGAVGYAKADASWNFAWAAYAGVGYQVTPNLTMDIGYRYVDLGDAKTTDPINAHTGVGGATIGPWTFKDITSHDVFLGFRYAM